MKKLICIILAVSMLLSVTACADKDAVSSETSSKSSSVTSENKEFTVTLAKDGEEFDTVALLTRQYLNDAANYKTDDYSYNVVDKYGGKMGGEKLQLIWKYSDAKQVDHSVCRYSLNSDLSDAEEKEIKINENYTLLNNLFTNATYYWQVEVFLKDGKTVKSDIATFKTKAGPRFITVDGIGNMRDLGGWKSKDGKFVKQGLVYRSAQFENVTEEGKKYALEKLGIKSDLDLRSADEIAGKGNPVPKYGPLGETVKFIHIPTGSYESYIRSTSGNSGSALRTFANIDNYPIIFHCAAGADRTGTLAMVVKALLGVEENDLVADYELTTNRQRNNNGFDELMAAFKKLPGDTLQDKAFNFAYTNCRLKLMEISNIYNILMTDSAIFIGDSLTKPDTDGQKATFEIDLRQSKSIKSVTMNGKETKFSFDGKKLTVNPNGDVHKGVITFDDSATLQYEY